MTVTATRILDNYIGGRWVPAEAATGVLDVVNPASGDVLARVPMSGGADLDAAVAAARAALPAWRAVSTTARAHKLFELRERLAARSEDLARSITTEMGKTIADARAEVQRMIEMVEAATAVPTTMQGRVLEDVSRNVDAQMIRQPPRRLRTSRSAVGRRASSVTSMRTVLTVLSSLPGRRRSPPATSPRDRATKRYSAKAEVTASFMGYAYGSGRRLGAPPQHYASRFMSIGI